MEVCGTLLSKYGATLSTRDVAILRRIVESDGESSILKFHPFIYGDAAPVYYSSLGDNRNTLFKLPKCNHVLGQYNRDQLQKTVKHFPLDLPLDPSLGYTEDRPDLYDPRFILYSLYHLLGPENAINCHQIIKSFGLSIALVGTSSQVPSIRQLSYLVLDRFVFHLESSKSSAAVYFWSNFLDCFRATMNSSNQQMPFLLTSLLAQIIEIVDTPKDSIFYALKDFVTAKPKFDTHQISFLFINLITSKDIEWKKCQRMVFNLLATGVQTEEDFIICRSNNLIDHILSLFSTKWVDWLDKILIIQFLKKCVQIPNALRILVIEKGLVVWLSNVVITSFITMGSAQRIEIKELVKLVHVSAKSTDLPKNCYKHPMTFIKSTIKLIDKEPAPESIVS